MAKARDIKRRIKSVVSTQQITKTMEMVSTSKLKKAQGRLFDARPYHNSLKEMTVELIKGLKGQDLNPLMKSYERVESVILLVITSNRGLCGAFNNNLIRLCKNALDEYKERGIKTRLFVCGKKGVSSFRYMKYPVEESFTELSDLPTVEGLNPLTNKFIAEFTEGRAHEVHIVSSTFHSVVNQKPVQEMILPIRDITGEGDTEDGGDEDKYLIEPSTEAILEKLLPAYVRNMVYQSFLETHTSEHAARRTAMKSASENADDMIKTLTRAYNRARQAQITQDLSEIVGGAEALKG
jgi:F-type H+-transporting ATPase subunit gamma